MLRRPPKRSSSQLRSKCLDMAYWLLGLIRMTDMWWPRESWFSVSRD